MGDAEPLPSLAVYIRNFPSLYLLKEVFIHVVVEIIDCSRKHVVFMFVDPTFQFCPPRATT